MYGDGGDGVEAWAWPRSRRATAKGVKMLFASRRYSALEGGGLLALPMLEKDQGPARMTPVLCCFPRVTEQGVGSPAFLSRL